MGIFKKKQPIEPVKSQEEMTRLTEETNKVLEVAQQQQKETEKKLKEKQKPVAGYQPTDSLDTTNPPSVEKQANNSIYFYSLSCNTWYGDTYKDSGFIEMKVKDKDLTFEIISEEINRLSELLIERIKQDYPGLDITIDNINLDAFNLVLKEKL